MENTTFEKNVIGYVRVSTDGQIDGFGLEAQKKAISDYCRKKNWAVIKWISDEGESGAKYRPGFDTIINGAIENPPFEAVVVAKSDRVARDMYVYFYYKAALVRKNIALRWACSYRSWYSTTVVIRSAWQPSSPLPPS